MDELREQGFLDESDPDFPRMKSQVGNISTDD